VADVTIHPAAEAEYQAALAWFQARSPSAARRFEDAFEKAVEFIGTFPEAAPLCDDRHRYHRLRRYPYGIVYRVDGDQARIVAVTHSSQLPGYWAGRT
jgi:plasmid stabilization system protein ParE